MSACTNRSINNIWVSSFLDTQYQSWQDFLLLVILMQVMWAADFIAGYSNLPFWTRCLNIGWRFRYRMPSQACQPN